jgi:hypothetical protein
MKVHQEHLKERVKTRELDIEYLKTLQMLADILTKPLGGDHYHHLVNMILSYVLYSSNRGAKEKIGEVSTTKEKIGEVTMTRKEKIREVTTPIGENRRSDYDTSDNASHD